jgi:hypothetical protein
MAGRILTVNEKQVVLDQEIVTRVSLAVILDDDFASDKQPIGKIEVSLKEHERQAIKNLSGYYIFTDVENGDYTVQVSSDYYFDEEREVTVSDSDTPDLEKITLKPVPFYPFSPGATLIKGMVKKEEDEEVNPVSGATVKVLEKDIQNQTTEKGEFVLYFTGLTEEDIVTIDKKRFVKGSDGPDSTKLTLEVTYDDDQTIEEEIEEVEESKTTSVSILITI